MKTAIATCSEKPNFTLSDRKFASALEHRGIEVSAMIWNLPNAQMSGLDAIIIRSTWDYHRHPESFLNWIASVEKSSIKLINEPNVIRWNLQKSYLLELEAGGAACVPSMLIKRGSNFAEIINQIEERGWSNLVVKPTISATAFLTFRTSASDPHFLKYVEQVLVQSDVLIQPYITSVENAGELSLIFFNHNGPIYSHAVLKIPRKGDFRVQSDFGGAETPFSASMSLVDFGLKVLAKISGDWTYARVDIVDWESSPLLSELELIEPDLFLSHEPEACEKFAGAVMAKLSR
jgi:glutathione synthase/RimK-type ligase-like ATP-grasp enzyme